MHVALYRCLLVNYLTRYSSRLWSPASSSDVYKIKKCLFSRERGAEKARTAKYHSRTFFLRQILQVLNLWLS